MNKKILAIILILTLILPSFTFADRLDGNDAGLGDDQTYIGGYLVDQHWSKTRYQGQTANNFGFV